MLSFLPRFLLQWSRRIEYIVTTRIAIKIGSPTRTLKSSVEIAAVDTTSSPTPAPGIPFTTAALGIPYWLVTRTVFAKVLVDATNAVHIKRSMSAASEELLASNTLVTPSELKVVDERSDERESDSTMSTILGAAYSVCSSKFQTYGRCSSVTFPRLKRLMGGPPRKR